MREFIRSIEAEYRRYKTLGEGAIAQIRDAELSRSTSEADNSAAVIVAHMAGNFVSRFTDFLTTDGEKPSRERDMEFEGRTVDRLEILDRWEQGWTVLFATLGELNDGHLGELVVIRGQSLKVHEALHRSLAHASYHVGQIVYLAKLLRGAEWVSLSIPRGASGAYNQTPTLERGDNQISRAKRGGS